MANTEDIRVYLATDRPTTDKTYIGIQHKLVPVDSENRILPGLTECIGTDNKTGTPKFALYDPRPLKVGDKFAIVTVEDITQGLKKASWIVQDVLYVPAQTFGGLQRMHAQQEAHWLKNKSILEGIYDAQIADLKEKITGIEQEKNKQAARFGSFSTLDTMLLHYFRLPPYNDKQER